MKFDRRIVIVAAVAVAALGAGGAAIARGVADGDEQVTGQAAKRAGQAAVAAIGGGTVLGVERQDGDGGGVYEVEVRRPDGSTVEIQLDAQFRQVGSAADDDGAQEADDDETSG